MTFLRDYSDDIFISYAHNDNDPLPGSQKGWIDIFHKALEGRLKAHLGAPASIWRDPKLQGNDLFADELKERIPKVAVLISVFSKGYMKSEWCLSEMKQFCETASQSGGLRVSNKARIFKVIKNPIPLENHPAEIRDMTGYIFYYSEENSGRTRELIDQGPQAMNFYLRVDDVAQDITALLEVLSSTGVAAETAGRGTAVYLARTTSDLSEQYDSIRRELMARGHQVLPDCELPDYGPDLVKAVRADLERAKLSIHLIGSHYGLVPEAENRSVVRLQNELAAERSGQDSSFQRLIWLPERMNVTEARQREYVERLETDSDAQLGADLMRSTLEDLKTHIQDKLAVVLTPSPPASPPRPAAATASPHEADATPQVVYLICSKDDYEAVAPLEDHLFNQGCEVLLPLMEGDEAEVRKAHEENLVNCDAVLIFYGRAGEPWLRAKQSDLQKAAGFGRSKPMLARAIYVAAPETAQKQRLRSHLATVIHNFGEFSGDKLAAFLAPLK
jgi:hypothetical protein